MKKTEIRCDICGKKMYETTRSVSMKTPVGVVMLITPTYDVCEACFIEAADMLSAYIETKIRKKHHEN